jgi:signal transduction histidine kinase
MERAISLLERGLSGIRDVVRSALVTYRVDAVDRPLNPADIDDLGLLIKPEIVRRDLRVIWNNGIIGEVAVPAGPVRQAVLNLLLNACHASPPGAPIELTAALEAGTLSIAVSDQGPGLDASRVAYLQSSDRAHMLRPGEPGLGLWTVRRLVAQARGTIDVQCPDEGGTTVRITIPLTLQGAVRNVA